MNSLSRQALNYLNQSESDDKQARNKLCGLILRLEKDFKTKINQLDEILLLHILNHLTECYLDSITDLSQEKHSATQQLIKRLTLSGLNGDNNSHATVFSRCTYYAQVILGEHHELDDACKPSVASDVQVNVTESSRNNPSDMQDFCDTECNEIPAPALTNIKIESRQPIRQKEQLSSVYSPWNQKRDSAFK